MSARKKICLLGAPGVGKTSLVRRFVSATFSDDYLTTIGVKIERKSIEVDGTELKLMIWDIHGEEGSLTVAPSFLKGASGYLLVIDGSRPETTDTIIELRERLATGGFDAPIVVVGNKADLVSEWSEVDSRLSAAENAGDLARVTASAKTGDGVEDAFLALGRAMLASS